MTPATDIAAEPSTDRRIIGLISAAHFVSHFYILVLPPLFTAIRADFGVSYVELGLALTAFNVVSALLQTPAGFLVDRVSARAVLIGGLLLGAGGLVGAALLPSYWAFVGMFALIGLGNTAYHPADYALLSRLVSRPRMGYAFSIHTFCGLLGGAVVPATLIFLAAAFGWRGAYLAAALLGIAVAALLLVFGDVLGGNGPPSEKPAGETAAADAGGALLLSPVVLVNLVLFMLLALGSGGIQNYSVVALEALRATPLAVATAGLSAYLAMSALGVLLGGWAATRTTRHDATAIGGLSVFAAAVLLVAFFDLGTGLLIGLLGIAGLCNGFVMPSRDMLVRAVTPPGAFGKVFGFVSSGFNLGGMVAPLLFGWLLDHGSPRGVFVAGALFAVTAMSLVAVNAARRRAP